MTSLDTLVAGVFRDEWGRVVAALIGMTGDWDLAEDCAQDAFAQALERWPRDGVPERPGAWLTTVARNRALDRIRRHSVERGKLELIGDGFNAAGSTTADTDAAVTGETGDGEDSGIVDDRLRLVFTCCHPSLPLEAQVALTLRTLAGLSTAEIARAFLVSEQTMAKRLVRAKSKIRNAGIPYRVPPAHLLAERTAGVLATLYLLFNEGYSATAGADLIRHGLCAEALRLTRILMRLLPAEPEAAGLLALMLFHDARRAGRTDAHGDLIRLEDQDRTTWSAPTIEEGLRHLRGALRMQRTGPYQLQAAIAGCHCVAETAAATEWPTIARLYGHLSGFTPSPVVALNRAVAVAMADGPAAGLALVSALEDEGALADYHLLHATRADLLRRLDRLDEAAVSYRQALDLASTDAERRHLTRRLGEVATAR